MSIWSKRITADAAFWGMITGFVFNVVPAAAEYMGFLTWPSYLHPAVIGTIISLATIIVISRKTEVTKEEIDYRARLHQTPETDIDKRKTKITMIAPLTLVLYGCIMSFMVQNYYVVPYQRGTEEIMPDGSMNWLTGEALFSLSPAILFNALGIFTAVMVWRSYHPKTEG
jgi:sodium/pantothenate symporter